MKPVIFIINVMFMGGAERIMSALANDCALHQGSATVILTNQSKMDANLSRLNDRVQVISLTDEIKNAPVHKAASEMQMLEARAIGKLKGVFGQDCADASSIKKYVSRNYEKICWLKQHFKKNADASLVAFLYDSIFLTLLSAPKSSRVIISERGDPQQSVASRTDMAFFRKMFPKADEMVFQSPDVRAWYRTNIGLDGTVIFNPLKGDLPQPYTGERKHTIVNFCRLDPQKNLFLLLQSFELLAEQYPDYELHIYGDPSASAREYSEAFLRAVKESRFAHRIKVFPARPDIHDVILDAAMFVSSSDFEGMSNSMLEAMAIGLPTVCTDCPAGGARAVIKDHENGLLVPIKDTEALYRAMKEVIDRPELSAKLSSNGSKIRQTQSADIIIKKWMDVIRG